MPMMATMQSRFSSWRELPFREIWVWDSEYYPGLGLANGGREGDPITPLCYAALELRTGRLVQWWQGEPNRGPPFRLAKDVLVVSHLLTADHGFAQAMGWGKPPRALCTYVEFRHLVNDARVKAGDRPKGFHSLAGALRYFREDELDIVHKDDMRDRIILGPPSVAERETIQRYNVDDVHACARVFKRLVPTIPSWPHALFRGDFQWALSLQERRGIPLNLAAFERLRSRFVDIRTELVATVDRRYGCYDIDRDGPHFRDRKFRNYLQCQGIEWPLLASGELDKQGETFRDMALAYPQLADLHELRKVLGQLRSNKLAVGNDGRNRTMFGPYGAKTGRNAPSNSKFIFGPSKCLRFLIEPPPGRALIYRDFKQEEFRILAVQSRCPAMLAVCESDDVYQTIAGMLGFPQDNATRAMMKVVVLGIQYGLEETSLALMAKISRYEAREVLARLRARFSVAEDFTANVLDHAGLNLALITNYGWSVQCPPGTNVRTIRNWPIQSAGSEIMHVLCLLAERRGIPIVAPVHDGFLAEADERDIDDVSRELDRAMRDASALVLGGYEIPTDDKGGPIRPGTSFFDKSGEVMWRLINRLLDNLDQKEVA
jgi:DNA polymerase-1